MEAKQLRKLPTELPTPSLICMSLSPAPSHTLPPVTCPHPPLSLPHPYPVPIPLSCPPPIPHSLCSSPPFSVLHPVLPPSHAHPIPSLTPVPCHPISQPVPVPHPIPHPPQKLKLLTARLLPPQDTPLVSRC